MWRPPGPVPPQNSSRRPDSPLTLFFARSSLRYRPLKKSFRKMSHVNLKIPSRPTDSALEIGEAAYDFFTRLLPEIVFCINKQGELTFLACFSHIMSYQKEARLLKYQTPTISTGCGLSGHACGKGYRSSSSNVTHLCLTGGYLGRPYKKYLII